MVSKHRFVSILLKIDNDEVQLMFMIMARSRRVFKPVFYRLIFLILSERGKVLVIERKKHIEYSRGIYSQKSENAGYRADPHLRIRD